MMAKYLVMTACFLKDSATAAARKFECGEELSFAGIPGPGLAPLDDAAFAAHVAARDEQRRLRQSQWEVTFKRNVRALSRSNAGRVVLSSAPR